MPFFPFYKFKCPKCANPIEAHSRFSGQQTKCPSCAGKIEVPPAEDSDGKNTWGNWSKGVILGTWIIILLLILGWVAHFLAQR